MTAPERHRHLDAVELPGGSTVRAVSWHDAPRPAGDRPDFGVYLDARWAPPWPHDHIDWPDFGLPTDPEAMKATLTAVLRRCRDGETVEIGCLGGHGRTGTALACLAVLDGLKTDPVAWVRRRYCDRAVETDEQAAFARGFGATDQPG